MVSELHTAAARVRLMEAETLEDALRADYRRWCELVADGAFYASPEHGQYHLLNTDFRILDDEFLAWLADGS